MSNFETIQDKLTQFIKRFYTNELLKGVILFFAIGLLYFLITLFIEYVLWLNTTARTILFWAFIAVELALFIKFIVIPLSKLFNLQKGISHKDASKIIGNHFPEVNDKLLNVLQLKDNAVQSELLLASIDQKSSELQPIPFKLAINFKENVKYLKYAAIPILIIALSYLSGKIDWFNESYERVVNYKTAYEPPAPFQFFVLNENLKAIEDKDYTLNISTVGNVIPENAQIHFNEQSYFLQQLEPGQFQFTIPQPKNNLTFSLSANDVNSKPYEIEVIKTPSLLSFDMVLDYPAYTKKKDELLKNLGSATIPEGTNVTWKAKTRSTSKVSIYAKDSLAFKTDNNEDFEATKHVFSNFSYSISTSNDNLKDYENLSFSLNVVKDAYPELNLKMEKDSIDGRSLYFYGQISDDYGLSKLQMVYYPEGLEAQKQQQSITINKSNFDEFVSAFPNQLYLEDGVNYEIYFQVFDNDVIHNFKSVKSSVFSYRKLTKDEEEQRKLEEQNETIEDINQTFDKLQDQDKKLEEFSKTQKEKEELNFNDKKKFEDFLKRQKEQEQLMQNFNKRLQDNLEEFQKEEKEEDQFKEDLQERLKENEEQLKKDEKLLEELEKLKDKISKEEFTEKLEQLAKQNKNKKRSMEQLLELTKRYYVSKKAEKLMNELDKLADKQEELSKKEGEENTKKDQEEINKEFEKFQKDMEELQKDNEELKKPLELPQDIPTEESIKEDQKKATEDLEKKDKLEEKPEEEMTPQEQQEIQQQEQNAQKKQKSAAKKMKQMAQKMGQMMQAGGGEQMSEDIEMLRQILDNLILFSFDQENLMNQFRNIDITNNQYGKKIIKQSDLREHFEHIDDSLFALSLRQPMLSEAVNKQITDVYFNIDKTLNELSENRLYQGISSQQYTITATNTLASYLSDMLDNMESQMNPGMGQGGQQDMQLPDIIMSQEQLNKQMQEGMKKKEGEKKGKEGEGQEGEQPKEGEGEQQQEGKGQGQEGEDGQQKNGKEGKQQGEGEGSNEELNGELYKIYQQQQQLRQALQDRIAKDGEKSGAGELIKKMEEIELDLINKGFTNQTLQKMMDLEHQLLKLENATFKQGQDNKRKSETNFKNYENTTPNAIPTAKQYFNTTEILNRQALPLQQRYKKKVQDYFKINND
ncbi:DUF4175 family protein [Ichthyenterobacterium sp. W332]|uniref:DUF4175 family protein n=1 Tax=Microcosmobacter mediterraneus TaxID=3075607 RepID=A0ABU2YJP2_9FLAO|nr:DUF4175 family protein [Ichthyenterobacterium sp. W332]MDT0558030.1 DUF4175 family protein [Ichthyenterobacterium sp. W332]